MLNYLLTLSPNPYSHPTKYYYSKSPFIFIFSNHLFVDEIKTEEEIMRRSKIRYSYPVPRRRRFTY